ncbi:MAG: DEAD/DEAH box helicase family protein, partial [Schwartzia sp.]|nr:DEAD/DEAH box helicase family protein [Schwartzia sp. (in: firmicutes)]
DEKDKPQLLHLIRIRDLTREVIRIQQTSENDDVLRTAQEKLNAVYDDYAETYGNIHAKQAKQLFGEDCAYPLLLSMEQTDEKGNVVGKSDIFTKRTIRPHVPPSHVDTAQEALIVSMTERGKADIPYMESLTGKSEESLAAELEYREMFWDDRTSSYQPADEYLSGDIRQKMEWLEQNIEFTKRQRDRDIWDSLLPPTLGEDEEYAPKNETEMRILDENNSYCFTDHAREYMDASRDWNFFFAYLSKYDRVYHLPDAATSNPLFILEAGLRVGDHADDTEGLVVLSDVLSTMHIDGLEMKKLPPNYDSPVLEFLAEGSEAEYPQKRACVHYLRKLLKEYDGTNAKALAERAGKEWPSVWRDWQEKFHATLDKGELLGLERMNREIERSDKNLAALQAVCPKDLAAEEISVRLGATWIPASDIEDFMRDTFGASAKVEYSNVNSGEWHIRSAHARSYRFSDSRPKAKAFSTPEYDALALLELTLNLRQAVVKKTVYINGDEKEVIDQEKTVLAQQKQEMLKDAFAKWVWQDENRKERLVRYYNRHFNNIRPREFDGSHLAFPGMNPEIRLKPHQKDAIAHTLYGGNTLLAHCVGAGKTFEMIASIMESKRLGLATKAMLVVPGHLTEQTGAEFMRLYPTANILVATKKDFEKSRRKEFCAKIATHNWDAVILGFTQFEKVSMSQEYIKEFTQDELARLSAEIEIAGEKEGKSFGVRQMERMRKSLEGKLAALEDKKPRDDVIDFESLGIDRLYVDEAHNFKNLGVITKLTRLPGISTTPAQKSTDFYQKVQYLNDKTNGKGLVFATGTAISNSMTELSVMQQYLQPDRLTS